SSPEALTAAAQAMGLRALALTDHDSLVGAVRFVTGARRAGLHAILGAEVTLADGHHLTLLAENQQGYANLCRLITASRLGTPPQPSPDWGGSDGNGGSELVPHPTWGRVGEGVTPPQPSPDWGGGAWLGKVAPAVRWEQLAAHSDGLVCLTGCRRGPLAAALLAGQPEEAAAVVERLRDWFGPDRLFVEIARHYLPGEETLVRGLVGLAHVWGLPLVATNNVHYAERGASRLRDALLAIDHNETLTAARRAGRLPLNDNYALAAPAEMARRFADLPQALRNSVALAERCQVSLDFSGRRLPAFPTPDGLSEFAYLYELCHASLPRRYPALKPLVLKQLAHELAVIEQAGLAGYFLIVWDIVRFARAQQIRCQGRGSAANSMVAYLLQITSIDPLRHNLLFERFLSSDRFTMPDIDIDFAADRREEVIQYVYQRYGRAHAAMVCNVVTFQARSALRDLAKVLDFPPPVIERLARGLERHSPTGAAEQLLGQVEPDAPAHHPLRLLAGLLGQIEGCPRHLSIHSGGMLITGPPLDEVVPLEPATMPGRVVAQWDKESVEDAGLIKLDLLGLRMLGLLSEAVGYVRQAEGEAPDLDGLSLDDPAIYALAQRGDTIGAFQVESRAQQQMAPRLRPTCFEEIIVQIAIIRPGPIQGGAVHPYLRRRAGLEPVSYPHPCLEPVLAETYGALLFQEQAIRVAVAAAGFSAGEADLLRRALSRTRAPAELQAMQDRFLAGAAQQGIDGETAGAIWRLLAGFAGYGFPKSHAASFALIAYQSLYLKHYHAAAFYCALLNQQPMGFYSSEVVVGDARRHGVTLLPPDIQASDWRYTLGQTAAGRPALRMGLCA
ncbi:MAG: DNA polymerase III subunit alpha, partial [Caldilineaceae bacterium]|nr:DNA polymerase III subunit alpha [Caldilineaceae bacterium]